MLAEAREEEAEFWLTPRRPFQLNDIVRVSNSSSEAVVVLDEKLRDALSYVIDGEFTVARVTMLEQPRRR